ncbi:hypothetical protein EII34_14275 [Arachnia propionica]|uniref:Uncharacterized protein n=1 Tax=Arachnia propionica TaxID=1750 RepID=A0A3P1T1X9_9ACTN|nr:DUF6301 family protein [Arachnia propionica]RRD03451.1 hypothetical protein EII34_14275 [Arachnia propionica]
MKSIPPDELIEIVQYWINQDWPLTEEQAKQACRNLGWTENEDGDFDTPYDFKINYVLLGVNRKTNQLSRLSFRISDVDLEETAERDTTLNDLYTSFITAFKKTWGKPNTRRMKDYRRASWPNLPNGSRIDLTNAMSSLSCYIYSPEYAEVERYLSQRGL